MHIGMKQTLVSFLRDESGAVTVDWVVLTAAIVALGVVVAPTVGQQTINLAGVIAGEIDEVEVAVPGLAGSETTGEAEPGSGTAPGGSGTGEGGTGG